MKSICSLSFSLSLLLFCPQYICAQISIANTTTITEDFNSMSATAPSALPASWKMSPAAASSPAWNDPANYTSATFAVSNGTPATGGKYNWGKTGGTDRSIGFISSQSYLSPNSIMAWCRNTNTENLTSLTVSYDLLQFRINTGVPTITFFYSIDGFTWNAVTAGDAQTITTGTSSYNFSNPANFGRSVAAGSDPFTITGLTVPPNGDIYLRWNFKTSGSSSSEGLALDNVALTPDFGTSISLTRGPYMNMATQTSIVIRWRTDIITSSKVSFGTSPGNLTNSVSDASLVTEHEIQLTGLTPNTKYYYSIGTLNNTLQGDANNYFKTLPLAGNAQKVRVLVMGDMGVNSNTQRSVRDAYLNYNGSNYTDVWLLVGDNAYENGLDIEYQNNFFNVYKDNLLKNHVLWPATGNHDYANSSARQADHLIPYYDMFSLPMNGEAGGVASNNEAFYSYDYGDIHFVSLDSYGWETGNTRLYDTTGPQATWLKQDLAANTKKWTVVYFHHPPYSKGVNSDSDPQMTGIRQNLVPILERYKVDLVLSGHSHTYERSLLLNGHYGTESTFNEATMAISNSSGKYDGTVNSCPYVKNSSSVRNGIVYVVVGSSGQTGGTSSGYPHNAMEYSNSTNGGCLVVDVEENRLDAKWVCADGVIRDNFNLMKDAGNKTTDTTISAGLNITLAASWVGNYVWSNGATTKSITVTPGANTSYTVHDNFNCLKDSFSVKVTSGVPLIASATTGNILCNGGTTTVTVTATGGVEPYAGTGDFVVSAGSYTYTVTDANGDTSIAAIDVSEPSVLTALLSADSILCNGGNSVITVTAFGGTTPYAGEGNFTVAAGTYNYTVTDANNCTANKDITISQPDAVTVSATTSPANSCNERGSITLNQTGGVAPFTYSIDGVNFVSSNIFNGLASGNYTGYVKDALCSSPSVLTGIVVEKIPDVVVTSTQTRASECSNDGTITLNATGGTSPFTYSIDGVNFVSANKFTALAAGTYTGYVKDALCPAGSLSNIVIGKAADIVITAITKIASSCADDGTITLQRTGGIAPFAFSIDGVNFVTSNKFTGLAAGTYTGYVKDARCPAVSLQNIVVGKAANIVVTAKIKNASTCSANNGAITLNRTGGVSPFTYSLFDGGYVSTNKFSNLSHGTYTGWVQDSRGCKGTLDNVVVGPVNCSSFSKTAAGNINAAVNGLTIKVLPNPTHNQFTLTIQSDSKEDVDIIVTDIYGRKIFVTKGNANQTYTFGSAFSSGMYVVQVIQGNNIQTLKLVKRN